MTECNKINPDAISHGFKTLASTIIVKDIPYKVHTAGDKDLTIIGIEEVLENDVNKKKEPKKWRGFIYPVKEHGKKEEFYQDEVAKTLSRIEEVLCNDVSKQREEGNDEVSSKNKDATYTRMNIESSDTIIGESIDVPEDLFSSTVHQVTEKRGTESVYSMIKEDGCWEDFYGGSSPVSSEDFNIYKEDMVYKSAATISKGTDTKEQDTNISTQSILQELQTLKSSAYALQVIYKNLQIDLTFIKKVLNDEIDIINCQGQINR